MARTQRDPKTDEELIEWIKSKETIKELRMDNYAHYQQCMKRGLKEHFPEKMTSQLKYTDEELIEWIKSFDTIGEMRNDSYNKYIVSKRRKLNKYFPSKRTRCGNIAGVVKVKGKRGRPRKNPDADPVEKAVRSVKKPVPDKDRTLPSMMYKATFLTGTGNILCGRCLEEKEPSPKNKNLCSFCFSRIMVDKQRGVDTNKWNVRDIFVNTKINHNEKVFYIGIRVDEKTQDYLTMVGYGFIFKECSLK